MNEFKAPALVALRDGRQQRYALPLTPEELREEITSEAPGKPARHVVRLVIHLDVYNQVGQQEPDDSLLPDLGFLRLLPAADAVHLEWGQRVLPVQPAQIEVRELAFSPDLAPTRAEVTLTLVLLSEGREAERYARQLDAWARQTGDSDRAKPRPSSDAASDAAGRVRDTLGGLLGRVRR